MTTFYDSGLKPEILKAIKEMGFEQPMPVQEKVIPVLLESNSDLIGLAQTGTGKTAAFGLPLLHMLDVSIKKPQALVLCPTRELCIQITKDFDAFSKYMDGVRIVAVYGGASIDNQVRDIKRGVQVIVATPGRLLDLIGRNAVDIRNIRSVVLDEADEMLNMGFQEDHDSILEETPKEKRTLMFSATMSKEIASIASNYMHDPVEIVIGKRNEGATTVQHSYYIVSAHDRYLALKRIIDIFPDMYGLVFCRTRQETKEVAEKLMKDGYNADALHGDLSQQQRDSVMQKFRIKNLQLLVATDVAARGLDVTDLTHVINYNMPDDIEIYTHRSGRTGRAMKLGMCVSIIHSKEQGKIRQIEKMINKKIERQFIPGGKEVCEKQLFNFIAKVENTDIDLTQVEAFLPAIYSKLAWLSKEDLIQRLVGLEFSRLLAYYENAPDLNKAVSADGQRETKKRSSDKGFARFFINLGALDGLKPAHLIGMIVDFTHDRTIEVGRIDIMHKFSFFECEESTKDTILKSFEGAEVDGRRVIVDLAQGNSDRDEKTSFKRSDRGPKDFGSRGGERKSSSGFDRKDRNKPDSDRSSHNRRSSGGSSEFSSKEAGRRRRK